MWIFWIIGLELIGLATLDMSDCPLWRESLERLVDSVEVESTIDDGNILLWMSLDICDDSIIATIDDSSEESSLARRDKECIEIIRSSE